MSMHKDLKPHYRKLIELIRKGVNTTEELAKEMGHPPSKLKPWLYQLQVWDLAYLHRQSGIFSLVDNYHSWTRKMSTEELIDRAWEIWEASNG